MTDEKPEPDKPVLPPQTLPESLCVRLHGFSEQADAEALGHNVIAAMRELSVFLDLGRVDGVTIAYDYDAALASLDRGFVASRPLERTLDGRIVGVAMAPLVRRDGVVKTHLVFDASQLLPLRDVEDPLWKQALGLLAHECAHAMMRKLQDEAMPGVLLQPHRGDAETALVDEDAWSIIDEFAACRLSGRFAADEQLAAYEACFVGALEAALPESREAIRSYRIHGNIDRVLVEAGRALLEPLRLAAYLAGHLKALDLDLSAALKAQAALDKSPLKPFVLEAMTSAEDAVRALLQGKAPDRTPLHGVLRRVLAWGGLHLRPLPDGRFYVDIPLRAETIP
jgi:hypothetical protein